MTIVSSPDDISFAKPTFWYQCAALQSLWVPGVVPGLECCDLEALTANKSVMINNLRKTNRSGACCNQLHVATSWSFGSQDLVPTNCLRLPLGAWGSTRNYGRKDYSYRTLLRSWPNSINMYYKLAFTSSILDLELITMWVPNSCTRWLEADLDIH